MAEYQAQSRGFQQAKDKLTTQLIGAGWELLDSIGVGGSVTLPRFQRRPDADADRRLAMRTQLTRDAAGTGSGGIILRRVTQMVTGGNWTYDVVVDGVAAKKLGPGEMIRLDLTPGTHKIHFHYRRDTEVFECAVEAGTYSDLSCGWAPDRVLLGTRLLKFVLRGPDGASLSPTDRGEPFVGSS